MDANKGLMNPICHNLSYKSDVRMILPGLIQLDGNAEHLIEIF